MTILGTVLCCLAAVPALLAYGCAACACERGMATRVRLLWWARAALCAAACAGLVRTAIACWEVQGI